MPIDLSSSCQLTITVFILLRRCERGVEGEQNQDLLIFIMTTLLCGCLVICFSTMQYVLFYLIYCNLPSKRLNYYDHHILKQREVMSGRSNG